MSLLPTADSDSDTNKKNPPKLCKALCKLQMPNFFTDLKGHKFPEEKESRHVPSKHKWQVLFNLTGQKFQTIN